MTTFSKKKQFYGVIKFSHLRALDEVESVEEIPKVVVIVDLFETAVEDRQVLHAGSANLVVFLKFLKKKILLVISWCLIIGVLGRVVSAPPV